MGILRNNKKLMLEVKTSETEMRNAFGGLISRLDMTEQRIYELKNMSI